MPSRPLITFTAACFKRLGERDAERNWQNDAACLGENVDPEIFFPLGGRQTNPKAWEAPNKVCQGCPVRPECLEYALKSHEPEGMWGGATPVQRSVMIKRRELGGLP